MNQLPIWFLVLAIFLPRISLLFAYLHHNLQPYHLTGWLPPTLGVLVPRALVLILVFQDKGFSPWLLIHALAMMFVYGAVGKRAERRS